VSCKIPNKETHSERLREDYKGAFGAWAEQVNRLQVINSSPAGVGVIEEAEARVSEAEVAYRDSRDRLTNDMVHPAKRATCD